jgi:hypothetical protein
MQRVFSLLSLTVVLSACGAMEELFPDFNASTGGRTNAQPKTFETQMAPSGERTAKSADRPVPSLNSVSEAQPRSAI